MKREGKKVLIAILLLIAIAGCSKKKDDHSHPAPPKDIQVVYESEKHIITCQPNLDLRIVKVYAPSIDKASKVYKNVSPQLLCSLVDEEGKWNSIAVSDEGAMGPTQLMPETAKDMGVVHPFNIDENVMGGAKYLSTLIKYYHGDIRWALIAYNQGIGNCNKIMRGKIRMPFGTRCYVNRIMRTKQKCDVALR